MKEKDYNENYINNKLKNVCKYKKQNKECIPVIRHLLSDNYIQGLEQGHFDNIMKEAELESLIDELGKKNFDLENKITILQNKIKDLEKELKNK